MFRSLFRSTLPLTLEPKDEETGRTTLLDDEQLREAYQSKTVLIVGGTRGIGQSIATALSNVDAKAVVVGRSADTQNGVPADLSTVAGCNSLLSTLEAAATRFSHIVFTVGVWPDTSAPYTSDGIDKVVALDLLARHLVLTGLASKGLLLDDCRVMCVLASCQRLPGVGGADSVKDRLTAAVVGATAMSESSEPPPRPRFAEHMRLLMNTAVAHDAWLNHMATLLPSGTIAMSTFPGLLVSDLPKTTLPSWLVPAFQVAMAPVADSPERMGRAHLSILASAEAAAAVGKAGKARRATFWAAPLLEARQAHPLAADMDLGEWVAQFLDGLAAERGSK